MSLPDRSFRVGVHEVRGPLNALTSAVERPGATAMQLFSKAKLSYNFSHTWRKDNEKFAEARHAADITTVVHAGYFLNLLSFDSRLRKVSASSLIQELDAAQYMHAEYVVVHPGTFEEQQRDTALPRIKDMLRFALLDTDWAPRLLLETMPGNSKWTQFGCFFDDLADVVNTLVEEGANIGTCFDTAHTFGAGYDFFSSPEQYKKFWKEWLEYFGRWPDVFHVNGASNPFGSRKDGHATLAGHLSASLREIPEPGINPEVFHWLRNDRHFQEAVHILETPAPAHFSDLAMYLKGDVDVTKYVNIDPKLSEPYDGPSKGGHRHT